MRHPEIETSTYNEPRRGSVCENITKHKASTTDRTSPMCECRWRYSFTAWRTTCLYGVTYSRASPRLNLGVTSYVSARTAHSSRCEWGVDILSPHGALRAYTVFLTAEPRRGSSLMLSSSVTETDRTVSDVRVGRVISCHRMAHCVLIRCFLQPCISDAPRWRYLHLLNPLPQSARSPRCEWG